MAFKRKIELSKINSVGAGQEANIELPTRFRYHAIVLEYDTDTTGGATEANMESEITEIRVLLNNTVQRRITAAQLFDINRTKGINPVVGDGTLPGYLPLFFSEPQRDSRRLDEATAWGMLGVEGFDIEVDIASGASNPTLKGYAVVDEVQESPAGIVKIKKNVLNISETGEVDFSLSTLGGDSYQGLYFFEQTAGDIENIRLELDGTKVYNLTAAQEDSYLPTVDAVPVSGMRHVILDDNSPTDVMQVVEQSPNGEIRNKSLKAFLNMGAANNVTLLSERVGIPD